MKIPLIAKVYDNKIHLYRNSQREVINTPFKNYVLIETEPFKSFIDFPKHKYIKVPEGIETDYSIVSFNKDNEKSDFIEQWAPLVKHIYKNNHLEQILIQNPNFFNDYPNESDLTIMYYDIEVVTKNDGFFPKPISNPILCIGFSIWKYNSSGIGTMIHREVIKNYSETDEDINILNSWLDSIQQWDPDIIADYNGCGFDFPYIIQRMQMKGISTSKIGRSTNEVFVKLLNKDVKISIPGRIHFDILNSNSGVSKDQKLHGIKSKSLKELARFYKADIADIELNEDIENTWGLYKSDPERLYSYQLDDVIRTEHVGNVYIRNCIALAEFIGSPLDNIMNMNSSFVPKIYTARKMYENRLINTENNHYKYGIEKGRLAQLLGSSGKKEESYQGALTGLFKRGLFKNLYKVDFKSMYPSAIETWNLGIDTTSLVEVRPYTGIYKFSVKNKYNWYNIPDEKFNVDLLIRVRNDKEGFLKSGIAELKNQRVAIKKELKKYNPNDVEYAIIDSQQNAIKVILNSIYGLLGNHDMTYGDMMSAMMVTAMCRWTTGRVIRWYRDELVELDTDGLIINNDTDENELNKKVDDLIKTTFKFKENFMELEKEELGEGYFYRTKNYVLREGDHLTIHGSSLKSSRAAKVVDRALKLALEYVFNNKPIEEVLNEAYNFKGLTIDWFVERIKLSKSQTEYANDKVMQIFLAKQLEMKTKQPCTTGTQISYVITKKPLPFPEFKQYYEKKTSISKFYTFTKFVSNVDELDHKHYFDLIDKVLEKFNIFRPKECEVIDLFGYEEPGELLDVIPEGDSDWLVIN